MADFTSSLTQGRSGATSLPASRRRKWNTPNVATRDARRVLSKFQGLCLRGCLRFPLEFTTYQIHSNPQIPRCLAHKGWIRKAPPAGRRRDAPCRPQFAFGIERRRIACSLVHSDPVLVSPVLIENEIHSLLYNGVEDQKPSLKNCSIEVSSTQRSMWDAEPTRSRAGPIKGRSIRAGPPDPAMDSPGAQPMADPTGRMQAQTNRRFHTDDAASKL